MKPGLLAGASAVVGGAAWVVASIVHASQPRGCVGEACSVTSMRTATTTTSVLMAVAGLMLALTGVGLLLLMRRRRALGRTAQVGAALAALGLTTLAAALGVQTVFFGDDFALMPWFVGPGVVALAAGFALLGWSVLRSRVLPRWAGISLLVGAIVLLGANEQTAAVLLAVPFGLAWIATGVALLSQRGAGETVGVPTPEGYA